MTYAVRTGLAVARMPQPEGYLLGPREKEKPDPQLRMLFQHANTVRWSASQHWLEAPTSCHPLRWATLLQVVHCFPELSTESLHSPVTRLTPGLDTELSCALWDRHRWPTDRLPNFPGGTAPLASQKPLDLPHLLTLGHLLPFE